MKREIPLVIAVLSGLTYIAAHYFTIPAVADSKAVLDKWFVIVTGFGCLVGLFNLTKIHLRNIRLRRSNWEVSVVLLLVMFGTAIIGVLGVNDGKALTFVYNSVIAPLDSTMSALLVFYLGAATYRVFRAKNLESTLLLVAGIIVMLGQSPVGAALSTRIPVLSQWLLDVPNAGAMRGILISASIGAVSQALRVVLGIEHRYLAA